MSASPLVDEPLRLRPATSRQAIAICVVACAVVTAVSAITVSQYYKATIRQLEKRQHIDRHRECARLLMWASTDSRWKHLPTHAFRAWLPIAKVSDEGDGRRRYSWINYTARTDSPGERDGVPAGFAWIIIDGEDRIHEMGYQPYDR